MAVEAGFSTIIATARWSWGLAKLEKAGYLTRESMMLQQRFRSFYSRFYGVSERTYFALRINGVLHPDATLMHLGEECRWCCWQESNLRPHDYESGENGCTIILIARIV